MENFILYKLKENTYELNDSGYGINCYEVTKDSENIIANVDNISRDKEKVLDMVNKMNEFNASPIHMNEIVEDLSK